MWRAACALISCCYTTLGQAASPYERSNNLNNINGLKFYHEIRGNLRIREKDHTLPTSRKRAQGTTGSVSKGEIMTVMILIYKELYQSISTFETPPLRTSDTVLSFWC